MRFAAGSNRSCLTLEEPELNKSASPKLACGICQQTFPKRELVAGATIRHAIADIILADHPEWTADEYICRTDLAQYRARYVQQLLEAEKGEITALEREVLFSLQQHEILSTNIVEETEQSFTMGQRLADRIARFGGSWTFITCFASLLVLWIALNSVVLWWRPVDPYPFILLNLILSCLAALQAPIIMMSQNRQEAKDRLRAQHDYQINLKAELEIRQLHEKIDHLLSHQWERLVEIQRIQLDLLSGMDRTR